MLKLLFKQKISWAGSFKSDNTSSQVLKKPEVRSQFHSWDQKNLAFNFEMKKESSEARWRLGMLI